jgi:hypothetical protein
MTQANPIVVLTLIVGIITTGCERTINVADYRPGQQPTIAKAPDSEVFVLWRWTPTQPPTNGKPPAPHRVARQFPVEVVEAFAERGEAVGFYRRDGRLLAIAGGVERPVDEAHYVWRVQPGTSARNQGQNQDNAFVDGVAVVFEVALVVVLLPVGLILMAYGDDNDSDFDSGNSGNNQGNTSHKGGSQQPSPPKRPTSKPAN